MPVRQAPKLALIAAGLLGFGGRSLADGSPGSAAVEFYAGLSFLALAAAYRAKASGTSPEERLHRPGAAGRLWQFLLLPYSLLAGSALALHRLFSREDFCNQVAPRVWVGSAPLPGDAGRVRACGITAVLNLCCEFPDLAGLGSGTSSDASYHRLPLLDGVAPTVEQLRRAVSWAAERHAAGETVLVHCAQGHGRSATVAAALLVRLGLEPGIDDAVARIVRARPGVFVGPAQRAACAALAG